MHGEAMGNEEIAATAELGWTSPPFEIPADIAPLGHARERRSREQEWRTRSRRISRNFPHWQRNSSGAWEGELPALRDLVNAYVATDSGRGQGARTRQSSQAA